MLRIYYGKIDRVPSDPDSLPLSPYRRERLAGLKPVMARRQSIGAELLLIRALAELFETIALPLNICCDDDGKPGLPDLPFHMNLSHSGSYAACALSDSPVGLDIQVQKPCSDAVLRRCFCPNERDYVLSANDPNEAFCQIWAKKESVLKAWGLGLRRPMNSFSVLDLPEGMSVWYDKIGGLHFSLCRLNGPSKPDIVIETKLP